jgi:hypothetical protein
MLVPQHPLLLPLLLLQHFHQQQLLSHHQCQQQPLRLQRLLLFRHLLLALSNKEQND